MARQAVEMAALVGIVGLIAVVASAENLGRGVVMNVGAPAQESRSRGGAGAMRLRGGVMWVGGGRQFNRTFDPDAAPESVEDTFGPLRQRKEAANRIKALQRKFGEKYRTNEVITLEEESKYLIRAQSMLRTQSLSVDLTAAQNFQAPKQRYVVGDLEFQQQRIGIMYGRVNDKGDAFCDVIYEPPQEGNEETYVLKEDPDAALVDRIASLLGLRKVGWVFTARPRKCILSGCDIKLSCTLQKAVEDAHGFDFAKSWVSAIITRNDTSGAIVFEAYQISDQCLDMHRTGVLKEPANPNKGYARATENVLVERKDNMKIDTDFFLMSVPIKTHTSPLFGKRQAEFPIENRPTSSQTDFEIKHILYTHKDLPLQQRLRDFHMILYIAKKLDPVNDVPMLCKAIVDNTELTEGHRIMIETLADA